MHEPFFAEKGSGPTLVLIHGFCETHEIWENFSTKLSKSFTVLMPDLPGFGRSSILPSSFSIEDVGRNLLEALGKRGITKMVVVGHSLGGYVSLAMANLDPARFQGLSLFHSTAYADTKEKKENRDKVIDFVSKNGVQPFVETFVPGLFYRKDDPAIPRVHEIASQTSTETLIAYAAAMRDRPDRMNVMETFPRPLQIIAGEKDSIIPYEHLSAQAKVVKFPHFIGLKDTGHMGMFENEPGSVKHVEDFVKLAVDLTE